MSDFKFTVLGILVIALLVFPFPFAFAWGYKAIPIAAVCYTAACLIVKKLIKSI